MLPNCLISITGDSIFAMLDILLEYQITLFSVTFLGLRYLFQNEMRRVKWAVLPIKNCSRIINGSFSVPRIALSNFGYKTKAFVFLGGDNGFVLPV
jgi:cytochrome b subunit of formate dehydrogenase